jgi:predicted aconitase
MNQDEIIEMARQAKANVYNGGPHFSWKELEAFAKLVAAKEREACAKLVESLPPVGVYRQLERATFKDAAIAIRARGEA